MRITRINITLLFVIFTLTGKAQNEAIDSLIARAHSYSMNDSLDLNRLSSWQRVFNEAKESKSNYRMEEICTSMGDLFYDYKLYEEAIEYYAHIFSTKIDTSNKSNALISIYKKIGQCHSKLNRPDSAYYYYKPILYQSVYPHRLDVLKDLVYIFADNDNHEKSLQYNLDIEKHLLENNASDRELSKIYNNIGYNYYRIKDYNNAILYFNKSLSFPKALSQEQEATILRNLGISQYNLGEDKESIELLKQAFAKSISKIEKAELAQLIATVYISYSDYIRAILYLDQAKQLAIDSNQELLLSKIYADYAEVYNITHDYDLAFVNFKNHSRLSDSLIFVDQLNQKRILDNQKYIEKTEKENRLLKAQQDFQKLQLTQLETEARNQRLQNNALRADSIQRVNELVLAKQETEIIKTKEENNTLEIARQKNLIQLTKQELEIAKANEENAVIEQEKQNKEIALAQQTISLQERNAQLQEEKNENQLKAREIEKRKTEQRNTGLFAGLLALLALFAFWAYRNKRKDNERISTAYENLSEAQIQLKAAETKIKGLLKQQVSGAIAETLMTDADIDGQRFVCVLFLDIRGFTVFCEGKKPSEIIAYQNSIFGFMINIIEKHHGVVNQLMGDGFMATFGAPISKDNDCLNAYIAAKNIMQTLDSKISNNEIHPTKIGLGMHAGFVVAGNVGYEERKQFSITGNTVILAARLEQLNKEFGSTLVYSKEFWEELPEEHKETVDFKSVVIKGRSKPMEVTYI